MVVVEVGMALGMVVVEVGPHNRLGHMLEHKMVHNQHHRRIACLQMKDKWKSEIMEGLQSYTTIRIQFTFKHELFSYKPSSTAYLSMLKKYAILLCIFMMHLEYELANTNLVQLSSSGSVLIISI